MGTPCATHYASYPSSPQAQLASAPLAASPPVGPACHVALCNPSSDMKVPGAGWQAVGRPHRVAPSAGLMELFLGSSPTGIACIALTFVDEHGNPTPLPYGERPDPLKLSSSSPIADLLQDTDFESLTVVSRHQPEAGTLHSGGERTDHKLQIPCRLSSPGAPWRAGEVEGTEPCKTALYPQTPVCWCAWISGRRAISACCSCQRSCVGPCAMLSAMLSWSSLCCRHHSVWKPPAPWVLQTWRT